MYEYCILWSGIIAVFLNSSDANLLFLLPSSPFPYDNTFMVFDQN